MNDDHYLLDTVTVSRMSDYQLSSAFVQNKCMLAEEILYELRGNRNRARVEKLALEIDVSVLDHVKDILMNTDAVGKVLDLYKNEGNGDILLVATALAKISDDSQRLNLFQSSWTIVSDDSGLADLAKSLNIVTLSTNDFIKKLTT